MTSADFGKRGKSLGLRYVHGIGTVRRRACVHVRVR